MCTILGWEQNWWSVAGLTFDLAGFALLAIDVAREYARHHNAEFLRAGANAAERLRSDPIDPPLSGEQSLDELRKSVIEQSHAIDRAMVILATRKLGHGYEHVFNTPWAEVAMELAKSVDGRVETELRKTLRVKGAWCRIGRMGSRKYELNSGDKGNLIPAIVTIASSVAFAFKTAWCVAVHCKLAECKVCGRLTDHETVPRPGWPIIAIDDNS